MEEQQWVHSMGETDDGVMSCLFNIGLDEIAPDASRPMAVMVRVAFKNPGEGAGVGEDEEPMGDAIDAVASAGEDAGAVNYATVRTGGCLDILFYAPDQEAATRIKNAAAAAFKGYEVETASGEDPEWEMYGTLHPSDEDVERFQDAMVIEQLRQAGDENETPRPVEHVLNFEAIDGARSAAKAAGRLGYQASMEEPEDGDDVFCVVLTRVHPVDLETISDQRSRLSAFAESHGGVYDGWGCGVAKG